MNISIMSEGYKLSRELDKEREDKAAAKAEAEKKEKENKINEYYNIKARKERLERERTKLLEGARDTNLAKALKAIYITSLMEYKPLTDEGIMLAEDLVDNYIKENGGAATILSKVGNDSYILARLTQLVEAEAEKDIEEVDAKEEDIEEPAEDNNNTEAEEVSGEDKDSVIDVVKNFLKNASDDEVKALKDDIKDAIDDKKEEIKDEKEAEKAQKEADKANEKAEKAQEKVDARKEENGEEESSEDDNEIEVSEEENSKDTKDDASTEESEAESDESEKSDNDTEDSEKSDEDEESEEKEDEEDKSEDDKEEESDDEDPLSKDLDDMDDDNDSDDESEDGDEETSEDPDDLDTEEDPSIDGDDDTDDSEDGNMFKELEKEEDIKSAIKTIRNRVADAEEKFIKNNAEDKKAVETLINKISDNVKKIEDINDENDKESKIAQEKVMFNKKQLDDLRNNRTLTIFEAFARKYTEAVIKNEAVKESYLNDDGSLDMSSIIESTRVMYGFLETLNTLNLEKVDEKYIEKIVKSIK